MKAIKYLEKHGELYGISYKPGVENSLYMIRFEDLERAEKWLYTKECDFRTREFLTNKAEVKKYMSRVGYVDAKNVYL